eukprot:2961798-Amphidinium_carterae.1
MPFKRIQKEIAAKCIAETWVTINKKLRNSPVGSRLTALEKAFRELENPREAPAPVEDVPADRPLRRVLSVNHDTMHAVVTDGTGTL